MLAEQITILAFALIVTFVNFAIITGMKVTNELRICMGVIHLLVSVLLICVLATAMEKKNSDKTPKTEHYELITTDSVYIKVKS